MNGWNEIASFLGRTVRTAQRWERSHDLPIHRCSDSDGEVVFALKNELEKWKHAGASRDGASSPGGQQPSEPRDTIRLNTRTRIAIALIVLIAAVLSVALFRSSRNERRAYTGESELRTPALPLKWETIGGSRTRQWAPGGELVDPGFVTVEQDNVTFVYEKLEARMQQHPRTLAIARLDPPLAAPQVSFTYVPHDDARITQAVGFASIHDFAAFRDAAIRRSTSFRNPLLPFASYSLSLSRSEAAYANSGAALVTPEQTSPKSNFPFQFEPGHRYFCTLTLGGTTLRATVTDGRQTEELVVPVSPLPEPVNIVFIADRKGGCSFSATPGVHALRFEHVVVRDTAAGHRTR